MTDRDDGGLAKEPAVPPVTLPVDLRDYFAAKAMQTLLAADHNSDQLDGLVGFRRVSSAAYCCADQMLRARNA